MPYTVDIIDYKGKLTIVTTAVCAANDPDILALAQQLAALHTAVPLTRFDLNSTPMPEEYVYKITTADGRVWKQTLKIPSSGGEELMTISAPAFWKLSEFEPHRAVRDTVVRLIRIFGCNDIVLLLN